MSNNPESGTALVPITTDQYIEQQLQTFPEPEAAIAKYKEQAEALVIADLHDTKGYKAVDELRKAVKAKRIVVDKYRKELLEVPKKFTKAVNTRADELIGLLREVEELCEAKQQPIDDEKARIKREAEEAEQKREAEEAAERQRVQARKSQLEAWERALLKGGFLKGADEYILLAPSGQRFNLAITEFESWDEQGWLNFIAEIKAWKAEHMPPAPAPAVQQTQPEQAATLPEQKPYLPPAPQPAPSMLPRVAKPTPVQPEPPYEEPEDKGYGDGYMDGFNAAKAIIVAHLHDPNVKLTREGWIEYVKSLPVQTL